MNPKEISAVKVGTVARSGEIVPAAGVWLMRCLRKECCGVASMSLHAGTFAPPCVRCCNMTARWRFLHAPAPAEVPLQAALPVEVPKERATFIRTMDFVTESGTYLIQCTLGCAEEKKIQHIGSWADPCSRCQSPAHLYFLPEPASSKAAAAEASATIVEAPMQPKEEKPVAEKAAAEVELSLFQRLNATGGHQTPANTSRAARK